jgi:hypothetical protein
MTEAIFSLVVLHLAKVTPPLEIFRAFLPP